MSGLGLAVLLTAPATVRAQAIPGPGEARLVVTVRALDAASTLAVIGARIRVTPLPFADDPDVVRADLEVRAAGPGAVSFSTVMGASHRVHVDAMGYAPRTMDLWNLRRSRSVEIRLDRAPLRLPEVRAVVPAGEGAVTRYRLDRETQALAGGELADWLRALPGFDVTGRGPAGPATATIRGSRGVAVDVTLDGISLADPLTGSTDLSLIPAATLESVVATAGAGLSPGWGGGAGSIRLRSRRAAEGIALGMDLGSFGRIATDVEVGVLGPAVEISAFGRFQTARNDFSFRNRIHPATPSERRINADYKSWGGVVRIRARAVPVTLITRVDLVQRGAPGHMGNHVWDEARWNERSSTLGLALGGGTTGLETPRLTVSWGGRSQEFLDPRVNRRERLRADQLVASGTERLLADVRLSWRGTWARVAGEALAAPTTRVFGGARVSRRLILSSAWSLEPAVALAVADEATAASPSLGLSWSGRPGWRMWARAGQGLRLPTFGDLFLRPGTGARPNPDLAPERIRLDAELGTEVDGAGGRLAVRTVAFFRRTDDPIIWLPSVVGVWQPTNAGRLTALGLETSLGWNPAGRWRAEVSATLQRSRVEFTRSSSPLPYHPAASGRVALEHRGDARGIRMDLELRGARRSSVYGPHELRPFGLLNFRGRQTFHIEGFDAVLEGGLLNVLDTTYERIELFPEPGRSMELRLTLRPMGPRNLQADTTNRSLGAEPVADDSSSSGREATGPGRNRSSQDRL